MKVIHGFLSLITTVVSSVATALSLYTHATRRRAALGRPGDLDPAAAELLLARYLLREQRGARAILEHARRAS